MYYMTDGHIPDRPQDTLVDTSAHIRQRKIRCLLPAPPYPTYAALLKHSTSSLETACNPRGKGDSQLTEIVFNVLMNP